ncbi:MAG: hypothetical protein ACREOI_12135 [bacterium]
MAIAMNRPRLLLGGALLLVGLLSLLNNLELFQMREEYVLSLIFAGCGAVLMQHGWMVPRKWTFYLGSAFVLVGVIIFIAENRFLPDEIIGTLWLWLGAGILYRIYQRNVKHWWVLLFVGPMFTIGSVVLLEGFHLVRGDTIGVLIMLGFAGTFAYVYSLRSPERKLDWAKYPAIGFFLIAVFILLANEMQGAIPFVISGLFILGGLYLIYRTVRADFGSSTPSGNNPPAEVPQTS